MNNEIRELFSLEGSVTIVTGALGLLGREHCRCLAQAGAHVIAADLAEERCREFASSLPTPSRGYFLDVTDADSVRWLLDAVMNEFSRIDVLVNNAGVNDMFEDPLLALQESMFEYYPLQMWKRFMDVNVSGVFLCSQVFGSQMKKQGKGSIINIASTYGIVAPDQSLYRTPAGEQAFFKSPAYPTSKGAVIAFTRYLAAYWGPAGVRVNALSPGGVRNGQDSFFVEKYSSKTPLGRMANPHDYRGALIFLASDASSYITGENLVADGGWTII
ncbi:MAG TPA: SDR family oxidoreductase [Thermodesulfovibrionales bacterium]|jgi:NAD(P)-dependent dehydrogenase (short-subunit alcohol dehydrogenase family)|nr:SDR family oxidoreductase [Thermodesulfovibrionales bacterium]